MAHWRRVPDSGLVSRSVKKSAPCMDCQEREVGCHSKCEKYKAFRERLHEDVNKRIEAYIPEKMADNYSVKLTERINKRRRKGR